MSGVVFENQNEWLAARENGVGASEAAAALGVSPYESPIDLWQRKTKRAKPTEENEAMRWGKLLEPLLASEYERHTGRTVGRRQEFYRSPTHPFLTATIDGYADDRLVEFKTTGRWSPDWGDENDERIPEPYMIQVAQQMAVTGADLADVALLIGGQRFKVFTVERDERLVDAVTEGVGRFWECVERDTPPTWGRMDAKALAVINPECHGEMEFDPGTAGCVLRYEEAKEAVKRSEEDAERFKLMIISAMGNHAFGVLPDGRRIKRHLTRMPAKTVHMGEHVRHYISFAKAGAGK